MLRSILTRLSSEDTDLTIITNDGRKMFTYKKVLSLFSKRAFSWLNNVSYMNDSVNISVDASYDTVNTMFNILSTRKTAI